MSPRKRKASLPKGAVGTVVFDTGALDKVADGDEFIRALWRRFVDAGWASLVPSVVLAETVTGRPQDARIDRVIASIGRPANPDEAIARRAGALRFRARSVTPSGIDALVAAHAATSTPSVVLTGDPDDLSALLIDVGQARVIGV